MKYKVVSSYKFWSKVAFFFKWGHFLKLFFSLHKLRYSNWIEFNNDFTNSSNKIERKSLKQSNLETKKGHFFSYNKASIF